RSARLQRRACPRQPLRAVGKPPRRARPQLRPPPLGIELLLGSNRPLEPVTDVGGQMTDLAHGSPSTTVGAHVVRRVGGWAWAGPRVDVRKRPRGDGPARRGTRSVDRGQEAAGGAIEGEPSVLPGRELTQSGETLHIAPDRS